MSEHQNRALVDKLFAWWQSLAPAGKMLVGGLFALWLIFIFWVSATQNALEQNRAEEVYLPAVSNLEQEDDLTTEASVIEQEKSEIDNELLAGATRFEIKPKESVASYSAVEEFFGDSGLVVGRNTNQGLNTAVGETRGITGSFYLDLEKGSPKILNGEFSADLQQLTSVQPHRDGMLKRFWLESNMFPTATFVITEVPTLPPAYVEGTPAAFPLTGILTVRDIEKEVTFDVVATLEGNILEATAIADLKFEDFGISPPNMAGVLQVEPNFKLIVAIVAEAK